MLTNKFSKSENNFFRKINQMKNQMFFYQSYRNSKTIFILICMIITICLFIFVPPRVRLFLSNRSHLQSTSSAFNYRYQLLTSFSAEDLPSTLPNTYSNIKIL